MSIGKQLPRLKTVQDCSYSVSAQKGQRPLRGGTSPGVFYTRVTYGHRLFSRFVYRKTNIFAAPRAPR